MTRLLSYGVGRSETARIPNLTSTCTCTHETTVSHMACFASLASINAPVLTFWQSNRKCRIKGNLSGPMKTGVGPGGPRPMAVL